MEEPSARFVQCSQERLAQQDPMQHTLGLGLDGVLHNPLKAAIKVIGDGGRRFTTMKRRQQAVDLRIIGHGHTGDDEDENNPDAGSPMTEDREVKSERNLADALLISEAAKIVILALTNNQDSAYELATMMKVLVREMEANI